MSVYPKPTEVKFADDLDVCAGAMIVRCELEPGHPGEHSMAVGCGHLIWEAP